MGLIFGTGAAIAALLMLVKLLPRAIGLTFWLGTTGFTATAATLILYVLLKGPQ